MVQLATSDPEEAGELHRPPPSPRAQQPVARVTLLDDTWQLTIAGVAGLFEMIAAAKECAGPEAYTWQLGFGVAVGLIGMLVCAAFFVLNVVIPDTELVERARPGVAVGLMLWWTAGVVVLTFDRPFTTTGNGFFASWVAWASCASLAFETNREAAVLRSIQEFAGHEAPAERRWAVFLLLSSLIETAAAATLCVDTGDCSQLNGFAVAAGALSMAGTAVLLFLMYPSLGELSGPQQHPVRALVTLLGVWWACCAGILTYDSPFTTGGNGFFSTWCSFVLSFLLAVEVNKRLPGLLDDELPVDGEQLGQPRSTAIPVDEPASEGAAGQG